MFNFEKLDTRHKAITFEDRVHEITESFPADEPFGMTIQMRRAALSIPSNLAADGSRHSDDDCGGFLESATGSLFEVVSQSHLSRNPGHLTEGVFRSIYQSTKKLSRILAGLHRSLSVS